MRRGLCAALLLAGSALAAEQPEETGAERDAVSSVHVAIARQDCAAAVARLNEGLARQYTGIYLMAGLMYEDGICLKPNWERAERLYLRAHAAGHRAGVLRLVAGQARNSRDPAAALWWAQQGHGMALPLPCRVPETVWNDPARFVDALHAWPVGQLEACVYAAGVTAMVTGDTEYPGTALDFNIAGQVEMTFEPAKGTIAWRTIQIEARQMAGLVSADTLRDRDSRRVQQSLEIYLRDGGDRALRQFTRPAAMPADWRLTVVFAFDLK